MRLDAPDALNETPRRPDALNETPRRRGAQWLTDVSREWSSHRLRLEATVRLGASASCSVRLRRLGVPSHPSWLTGG
jgi:hypothetical protein